MAELQMLLDQEIPGGRKALLDSHNNLQKVASYCAQHYVDEANKKTALEETKNYTTQSLASVAYQINTLASNMLHMLDIQAAQLANMDLSINNIAQTVDIHKEKVARREIGLLTTNKVVTRSHQIVAPTTPDRPVKYVRKPIDYTELDDIGHGVKLNSQPNTGTARRSTAPKKSPNSSESGSKRDSLKSNMSGHGTLRPVRAPTVPQDYNQNINRRLPSMLRTRTNSNSSTESGSRSSSTGYMPGIGGPPLSSGMPPPPPPPEVPNVPTPPSNIPPPPPLASTPEINNMPPLPPMMSPQMGVPPPPPIAPSIPTSPDSNGGYSTPHVGFDGRAAPMGGSAESYAETSVMDLPPPPPTLSSYPSNTSAVGRNPNLPTTGFTSRISSADMGIPPPPPIAVAPDVLPPPPPSMGSDNMLSSGGGSSMEGFSMEPDWAPKTYLEKMVVIYDYSAENADELNLREDQVVYVVKKNDDGWYEGVLHGVTGLFPGNYAEPVSS